MKIKKLIYGLLGAGGVLVACDKIEEGYMSIPSSLIYWQLYVLASLRDVLSHSLHSGV